MIARSRRIAIKLRTSGATIRSVRPIAANRPSKATAQIGSASNSPKMHPLGNFACRRGRLSGGGARRYFCCGVIVPVIMADGSVGAAAVPSARAGTPGGANDGSPARLMTRNQFLSRGSSL